MTKTTLALTLCAAILSTSAASAQDPERVVESLNEKAVMIEVSLRGSSEPEFGTGVVICQDEDNNAWILSANHVFAGKSQKKGFRRLSRKDIAGVKMEFRPSINVQAIDADNAFVRQEMKFVFFGQEDLVLLSVPVKSKLPSEALAQVSPPPDEEAGDEMKVSATGFWIKGQPPRRWMQVHGALEAIGRFLYHDAEVHEGFSGGPLYDDDENLIGINIERVPGRQTPVGGDSWFGKAQSLNEADILEVITGNVPGKCLKDVGRLSELATVVYREAMQAVTTRRWELAEEKLLEATRHKPTEGGRVHLEGLRYTTYLPHFYLGRAQFKRNKFSEAIGSWDRSESQGTIQQDKRYRKLKKWRRQANGLLRVQDYQAEEAGEETQEARAQEAYRTRREQREDEQRQQEQKIEAQKAEAEREEERKKEEARKEADRLAKAEQERIERTPTHQIAARATPCLNLRDMPTLEGARTGCIEPGAPVVRLRQVEKGDWSWIRRPGWDDDWLEGWVASEYLQPLPGVELKPSERRPTHRIADAAKPCLIFRLKPSRNSNRLDCLKPGSIVRQLYQSDAWSRVRLKDGREGWAFSARLDPLALESGETP